MTRGRRRGYGWMTDASRYGGKVSESSRPNFQRPAGALAWFDGQCWKCDRPIQRHVDHIIERRGEWVHVACEMEGRE